MAWRNFHQSNISSRRTKVSRINEVYLIPNLPDTLIFTHAADGRFNIKIYLEQVIAACPNMEWTNLVWNSFTTPRVNAFMWRLYHNALSVDENVQAKAIILASKCVCCGLAHRETVLHLFFESDIAKEVWSHFATKIHKPTRLHSIPQLVMGWLYGVSHRSQLGYSTIAIIFYGLWEIWKERCRIKFEDVHPSIERALRAIYDHIYSVNLFTTRNGNHLTGKLISWRILGSRSRV